MLPVRAPRSCQSRLRLIQTYKGMVECEESHCYSSPRYDRRLRSLLTNWLGSRRHSSEVAHWFRSITPHVQWPQQHLIIEKALTAYSNQAWRQKLGHRHAYSMITAKVWRDLSESWKKYSNKEYSEYNDFKKRSKDKQILRRGFKRRYCSIPIDVWASLKNCSLTWETVSIDTLINKRLSVTTVADQ